MIKIKRNKKSIIFLSISILIIFYIIADSVNINTAKPQLEQNDTDIFIKYGEIISDTIKKNSNNNRIWEDYYSKITELDSFYYNFHNNEPKNLSVLLKQFKKNYYEFINNYAAPDELYNLFNEIEWGDDGHKKLWTIYFCRKMIDYKNESQHSLNLSKTLFPMHVLLYAFSDKASVSDAFKELNYEKKIVKYNKKGLNIFNTNDLKIIENKYKELDRTKFDYRRSWYEYNANST